MKLIEFGTGSLVRYTTREGFNNLFPITFELYPNSSLQVLVGFSIKEEGVDYEVVPNNGNYVVKFKEDLQIGLDVTLRRVTKATGVPHTYQYTGNAQGGAEFSAKTIDENFEYTSRIVGEISDYNKVSSDMLEQAFGDSSDLVGVATEARDMANEAKEIADEAKRKAEDVEANAASKQYVDEAIDTIPEPDLTPYRKLDDNVFNGLMTIKSDNDEQGAGVLLQDTDGTVSGKIVAADQGLQLTQYPKDGGLQTFTFPSEGGEVPISTSPIFQTNPIQYGAVGNGVTNDTEALNKIPSDTNLNLLGNIYNTDSLPKSELHYNGGYLYKDQIYWIDSPSVISGKTSTPSINNPYSGGANNTPTVGGATNQHLAVNIASQNCRASFSRSANIASIYSHAGGNVSANIASRQSNALSPQSANIGSEECQGYGFRNVNIGAIFGYLHGSSVSNISSRHSSVLGYYNSINASNTVSIGYGRNLATNLIIENGKIVDVEIINGGSGFTDGDLPVKVTDRSSKGSGGEVVLHVVKGKVEGFTILNEGENYSDNSVLVLTDNDSLTLNSIQSSELSYIRGGSHNNITSSLASTIEEGSRGVILGANNSNIKGEGSSRGVLLSTGSSASASFSVVIGGNNSHADHEYSLVRGRRVRSRYDYSFAMGNHPTGSASTENIKFEVTQAGNVNIAGTLTQNASFTDIAKMFENIEVGEIPVGSLVTWEGRKVRLAREGDTVFSAHSRSYVQLLGDSDLHWNGRYIHDEYGRKVVGKVFDEDLGEYVDGYLENPDYDPTLTQVARSDRHAEWTPVALVGEVFVNIDTTVKVGGFVKPSKVEGIGADSQERTNLMVMEINEKHNIALCLII